jgi:hypothetical protein
MVAQVNLVVMSRPVIAPSANKHGIADDDIMHAYRNPIRRFDLDEGLTMLVGPDRAAKLLEVGVVAGDPDPVVVHAMECRERFLTQIEFRARDERGKGKR